MKPANRLLSCKLNVFFEQLSAQEINYSISLIIKLAVVIMKLKFFSYFCLKNFVILAEKNGILNQVHSQTTIY